MKGAPGLIIAAPASGSGKTTLTLALLRHLRDQNSDLAPWKAYSLMAIARNWWCARGLWASLTGHQAVAVRLPNYRA